jgi:hypothetical protein
MTRICPFCNKPLIPKNRCHCKNGHALTEDNVYRIPGGSTQRCVICRQTWGRTRQRKSRRKPDALPWSSWLIKYTDEIVAEWRARVLAGETQAKIAREDKVGRRVLGKALYARSGGDEFRRQYYAFRKARKAAGLPMYTNSSHRATPGACNERGSHPESLAPGNLLGTP